jgi:hypothetical protein
MVGHVPCRACNPGPSRAYIVFLPTSILSSTLILLSLFLIRPRGVEVLNHTLTDIKTLERLQVQICKQIQGLPERTANLAAYSLLGVEPIDVEHVTQGLVEHISFFFLLVFSHQL